MASAIKLSVVTGPHRNKRYCFRGPTNGVIGRGSECLVQLSGFQRDGLISRKHCFLAAEPPNACLCDLGSVNGTYVNGRSVSPREAYPDDMNDPEASTLVELQDGDVITVGGTSLMVELLDCPHTSGYEPCETPDAEETETNNHHGKFCNWACLYARQSQTLNGDHAVVWED